MSPQVFTPHYTTVSMHIPITVSTHIATFVSSHIPIFVSSGIHQRHHTGHCTMVLSVTN